MFADYLQRTQNSVTAIRGQLATNDYLRAFSLGREQICSADVKCDAVSQLAEGFPDIVQWRILDHCTTFTRLYAVYEQFVYSIIETMLSFYEQNYKFTDLPQCLTNGYKLGFAKIVEKIGGPRYSDISLANLLESYKGAIDGRAYKIEPRAILMHDQNLRLDELNALFAKCDIGNIKDWLNSSSPLKAFFDEERSSSTVEAQLRSLVQFRNDAAHGGIDVDDILNSTLLLEYVDFVQALCASLAELVRKEILRRRMALGISNQIGIAKESFKQGRVAIIDLNGMISVGQKVYVLEKHSCVESEIINIQVNGENHQRYGCLYEQEIGVEIRGRIKVKSKIISAPP